MGRSLVVVPCGQRKIWDRDPAAGPTPARDAYTGGPFKVNRAYAECIGDEWLILSARYGLIPPSFPIPGPYDATFKRRRTHPVDGATLCRQAAALGPDRFDRIVVLGGADYRAAATAAFAGCADRLCFPTAGLGIGKAMQRIKRLAAAGTTEKSTLACATAASEKSRSSVSGRG